MKSLIFVQSTEISYSGSNTSRFLNITSELRKLGIDSLLIGPYSQNRLSYTPGDSSVLVVKPILSQNSIIGRRILILQIEIVTIKQAIAQKSKHIYLRGWDMPLVALFAKITGRNLITEFHGFRYLEQIAEGKKFYFVITTQILEKLTLKLSNYVVFVSSGIQAQIPPKYTKRLILIQNGVDVTAFEEEFTKKEIVRLREKYHISPDKKVIGFVGTGGEHLNKYFQIDDLIEFQRYIDSVQSVIVCNSKEASYLIEKAKQYSNVILTDLIPHREVVILLKHIIDICILPYKKEHYRARIKNFFSSRKSSEYLAAGKPIIASDIPGIEGFLKEGENYITYESKNPQQLAEKIKLLLGDRNLYQRLCESNLKLAKELTWEQNIRRSGLLGIINRGIISDLG